MTPIATAFSTFPNHTFIFNAMTEGCVDTRVFPLVPVLADVVGNIGLYVNEFTRRLGQRGREAMVRLGAMARERGVL